MTNKEAAIAAIRTCRTRDSLDEMFNRFEITGAQNTIDYLNECMYNPQTFFASKPITIEDELEFTKQVFLTGTWRLNDYYDRMGIEVKEMAAADA
jgi:hypothetical protein